MTKKNDLNNKILSVLSYIGILFLISFIIKKNDKFVYFHIKEGFKLFICELISNIFILICAFINLALNDINFYKYSFFDNLNNISDWIIYLFCIFMIVFGILRIIGMINVLRDNTNELPIIKNYKNIIKCSLVIGSMFIIPSIIALILFVFINSETICTLLANFIYIVILFMIYKKDMISEFKLFTKNFKDNIISSFKFYFIGLGIMFFSNLLINAFIGEISANETIVRETIFNMPFYAFISVAFVAPLSEELVFRKSLRDVFKNKWLYSISCGVLFGLAHIISLDPTLIDLVYIVPYGALGFAFALSYDKTKTIYSSIAMHMIHNTIAFILLILVNFVGVI